MHQCLQIQEILEQILESVEEASSLAALARTCSWVSKPALDLLWGTHGKLDTLLGLMPQGLLVSDEDSDVLNLTRPLIDSDWTLFRKHSHRVERICVTPKVPLELLHHMQNSAPPNFSNVRSLSAFGNEPEYLEYMHLFLSPKLRHLEVGVYTNAIWDASYVIGYVPHILHDLPSRCPGLRHIDWDQDRLANILQPQYRASMSEVMSDLVCHYDKLECLYIPQFDLSPRAVRHILSSPSLQNLHWRVDDRNFESFDSEDGAAWSALSILHQWAGSLQPCISVIGRQRSLKLRTLHVRASEYPHGSELLALSSALRLGLCHTSVKDIGLNFFHPGPMDNQTQPRALNLSHFEPLFSFQQLTRIRLSVRGNYQGCTLDLTDHDIHAMASAWPSLERIEFCVPQVASPSLTINGFITLIAQCKCLIGLSMWFNFSMEPLQYDKTALNKITATHPKIMSLNVLTSPIYDVFGIAKLLTRICPGIGQVYSERSPYQKDWETVSKMLMQPSRG